MNRASLRQVVTRPSGPVDPDQATAHVLARLPGLDEPAARALALVDVAGRGRADAAARAGVEDIGETLARARKALRRSVHPLSGSGWCERAERMISDDIDGELADPGPARLAVHLDNCSRCVEHGRRLAQARDGLVRSFPGQHPEPELAVAEPLRSPAEVAESPELVQAPAPAAAESPEQAPGPAAAARAIRPSAGTPPRERPAPHSGPGSTGRVPPRGHAPSPGGCRWPRRC